MTSPPGYFLPLSLATVILTENLTFDKVVSDFGLRTEFSSLLPAPRHMVGETVQPISV